MRWFVRQSIKRGQICALNYYYILINICDDNLKIISEELNIKGYNYDFIEANLNCKNKHFKVLEKEYEKNNDYRDQDVEEKEIFIKEKLSQLPIHQILKQIKLDELLWMSML